MTRHDGTRRAARALVVLLAAALPAACAGDGSGAMMEPLRPLPAGWADSILKERAEKNRAFREGADSPLPPSEREGFEGLDYWPPDPEYVFVGPVEAYDRPVRFTIITTTGRERPCEKYGRVGFRLHGRRCTLQVYRLLDVNVSDPVQALFLPFTDATTGRRTYPAGRYVDLAAAPDGSGGRKRYVLDFNRAYNPLCAYGAPERYACPVTPAENRLPVAVEAGERGFHRRSVKDEPEGEREVGYGGP